MKGRGGEGFLAYSLVPIKFPNGSQVLKMFLDAFPNMFPIAPAFYPIWFAQSSTSLSINYNPERTFASILQLEVYLLVGMPNVPIKLLMGKINMASFQRKKKS